MCTFWCTLITWLVHVSILITCYLYQLWVLYQWFRMELEALGFVLPHPICGIMYDLHVSLGGYLRKSLERATQGNVFWRVLMDSFVWSSSLLRWITCSRKRDSLACHCFSFGIFESGTTQLSWVYHSMGPLVDRIVFYFVICRLVNLMWNVHARGSVGVSWSVINLILTVFLLDSRLNISACSGFQGLISEFHFCYIKK